MSAMIELGYLDICHITHLPSGINPGRIDLEGEILVDLRKKRW